MIAWLLLGLGLVLCIEGLVFALAPNRLEDLVQMLSEMSRETRRTVGLIALGLGVVLIWMARLLGI